MKLVFGLCLLPLAAPTYADKPIRIAAAANLSFLAEPIKAAFAKTPYAKRRPGATLDFFLGASGALATQIESGLPVEVFLSADTRFPEKVAARGLAAGAPRVYAIGKLVLFNPGRFELKKGLASIAGPNIAKFAIANPETAPYGRAAVQALTKAGLWEGVKSKAVVGQTITQAIQMTLAGTGLGFVHQAALYGKDLEYYRNDKTAWLAIDPALHEPVEQAFVILKRAGAAPGALAFGEFLLSPSGRELFAAFGYALP